MWYVTKVPSVLGALDPMHALGFVAGRGFASLVVLGSVLLAIAGAEALYADVGHFGERPIRIAWFGLVAPALALNYFGQGALLIARPAAIENPFYLAFPAWALCPMVGLATAVFLAPNADSVPSALLHSLKRFKVLHERVVFLSVEFADEPWAGTDRVGCRAFGLEVDLMETSFFLSRETIVAGAGTGGEGMAAWRDRLFAAMTRNAGRFTDYFNIPGNRVVELGSRVEI